LLGSCFTTFFLSWSRRFLGHWHMMSFVLVVVASTSSFKLFAIQLYLTDGRWWLIVCRYLKQLSLIWFLCLGMGRKEKMKRLRKDRVQREEKTHLYKVLPSKLMPLWTKFTQYTNNHFKEGNQSWTQGTMNSNIPAQHNPILLILQNKRWDKVWNKKDIIKLRS
jgi:hypothetical protein